MASIQVLPDKLISQIAAGEVVERPASVVKELIENSLDASATRLIIEVEKGGQDLIRITDNGSGMTQKEAPLAFARHATSKIATADDLFNITTMGFRGEALASIASVAQIKMQTKRTKDPTGTELTLEGGQIKTQTETGCPNGTLIEVRNLFFNVPARRKFLKAPGTEFQYILNLVNNLALSHPTIHFKFFHNRRLIFDLPPVENELDRFRILLGREFAEHAIPVFYESTFLKIRGFVGIPDLARTKRTHQYLFVNHRPIQNNALAYAVSEGYQSLIPERSYPVFVLKIEIDPKLVDVNVHPRKTEVRFINPQELFQKVKQSVQTALDKNILTPTLTPIMPKSGQGMPDSDRKSAPSTPNQTPSDSPKEQQIRQALHFTKDFARTAQNIKTAAENQAAGQLTADLAQPELATPQEIGLEPIAQLAESYLIAKDEEGITIIDQHAAHERILYAKLMENLDRQEPVTQPLLLPLNFELSFREVTVLKSERPLLKNLGFEIENFGGNTFTVSAIPACLNQEDIDKVIKGLLDDLIDETSGADSATKEIRRRQEKVIHYIACRAAVKFGRELTEEEQLALLKRLKQVEQKYTCPHGRPTMIKLTFEELEKRFKRG